MNVLDAHVASITNQLLYNKKFSPCEIRKRLGSVCASNARASFDRLYASLSKPSPTGGRVGGGIAAPRPSQSRACAIDALGSSPDRFAQEALMLPRLFGYPLLFRVRVGGTQSVLQRFPSVVLYR